MDPNVLALLLTALAVGASVVRARTRNDPRLALANRLAALTILVILVGLLAILALGVAAPAV